MKKFLLLFLMCSVFSVNALAQEENCWFDKSKVFCTTKEGTPYTGFSVVNSKNGSKTEANFVNGLLLGDFKTYNPQGVVIEEGTYLKEISWMNKEPEKGLTEVDSYISRYPNGQIRQKGNYKKCGDHTGTAQKEGHWTEYYENGVMKSDGNYKLKLSSFGLCTSIEDGVWFYSSDKNPLVSWQYTYANGVEEGPYVKNLRVLPQNVMTLEEGTDEKTEGELIILKKGQFSNGKPVGEWEYYYEDGNLWQEQYYDADGKESGIWTCYGKDGEIYKRNTQNPYRAVLNFCWGEHDI